MKAAIYNSYGPPDVLTVTEVDKPTPTDNEVLVRVHMATMNRTDTGLRSANYFISRFFTGLLRPKQPIGGSEFAGEIVQVGANVTGFKVGDKVFGFDDMQGGAHAEFMTKKTTGAFVTMPTGFNYEQVAAAGEGATYALNDIRASGIKQGQTALVYGASGAIGSAAVQLLKHMGVHVTAVCGTKNVQLMQQLGADEVVDYQTQDFLQTNNKFVLIFDAVGKTSYGACKNLLAPGGKYCSTELGKYAQNPLLAIWFALTRSRKVIFPIPKINKEIMEYLKQLIEAGAYKPVVDRTYLLSEVVEAARYAESGQKTGNVLLKINSD